MNGKKYYGIAALAIAILSLLLVACGDESVTVGNNAATPTVSSTTAITNRATTTAPATTSSPTNPTTTTATASTPAANDNKNGGKAKNLTPEVVVKKVYTDFQSGDFGKADKVLVSADLQAKVRAKGGLDNILALAGVDKDQKISSFTLSQPTENDDTATINVTLQLSDGKSVVNAVTVKKGGIKTKTGGDLDLWQVSQIEIKAAS